MTRNELVHMAYAIIDMSEELTELRRENEHLREMNEKRKTMLDENLNHSKDMLCTILDKVISE